MTGMGPFARAADRLDAAPWPVAVLAAVEVVTEHAAHAARCQLCLRMDDVLLPVDMLAAFTDRGHDPGLDELASALVELATEIQHPTRHLSACGW